MILLKSFTFKLKYSLKKTQQCTKSSPVRDSRWFKHHNNTILAENIVVPVWALLASDYRFCLQGVDSNTDSVALRQKYLRLLSTMEVANTHICARSTANRRHGSSVSL